MSYKDKVEEYLKSKENSSMPSDSMDASLEYSAEKIQDMVNDLEDFETEWSSWEQSFMASITDKLERDQTLTVGQMDKLKEIHTRYMEKGSSYA